MCIFCHSYLYWGFNLTSLIGHYRYYAQRSWVQAQGKQVATKIPWTELNDVLMEFSMKDHNINNILMKSCYGTVWM